MHINLYLAVCNYSAFRVEYLVIMEGLKVIEGKLVIEVGFEQQNQDENSRDHECVHL